MRPGPSEDEDEGGGEGEGAVGEQQHVGDAQQGGVRHLVTRIGWEGGSSPLQSRVARKAEVVK